MLWVLSKSHFLGMIEYNPLGALPYVNYLHINTVLRVGILLYLLFFLDIEMKCNRMELFKQLFFISVVTWVHYHMLPVFIIPYQTTGIKYTAAEAVEEAWIELQSLRDGESIVSNSAPPGLRPETHRAGWAVCSQVRAMVATLITEQTLQVTTGLCIGCHIIYHPYMDTSES